MTHEDLECLPVRLKSCGSVFSSFLSYILVIDLSGLFQGVSRRFRASTDGRTVIRMPNRMARWLAGGKSVKGKLSKINFYQHQTLSNIKLDQYKQLFNQQKSSQASGDSSDRASEDCLILPASLPASLEQLRQMLLQAARPTSTMCWSLRHIWASSLEGVHAMVSLKSCSESSFRSGTDVTRFT